MIYTIGNSHAHFFTNSHPGELGWGLQQNEYFKSYSANFHNPNPQYRHVLAHKFYERYFPYIIDAINSINFTKNDYIMLIVGEIDCRWHFPKKEKTQNRLSKDIIKECIDEYFFPSILHLKENEYNVIGWGGHASTTSGHSDDPDNPIYGDCLTRNRISLEWNDYLHEKCKNNNIKFVSIIKDLIDDNGLTKMEYFMDNYHLNQKALPMIINQLKQKEII